jgi:acetoacetate decarboxylase
VTASSARRKDPAVPLDLTGGSGFSVPLGASLYPPPPHHFRGAQRAFATYEADAEGVASLLPPGVTADSDPPICQAWACWYPWSVFGAFHEAYIFVRVTLDGARYWYQPLIFTDSEPPLTAGREIWGFPKKLATMAWSTEAEQLIFTVERPVGKRIMTFTLSLDRLAQPTELEPLPVLSLRYLPASDPARPPAAAELVTIAPTRKLHDTAGLGPDLWAGRASVTMDSPSEVDPWYRCAPTGRILSGFVQTSDFSLPLGTVVKDYIAEGLVTSEESRRKA